MATERARGVCPWCEKIVSLRPETHACRSKGGGMVLNQPGPTIPLADSAELAEAELADDPEPDLPSWDARRNRQEFEHFERGKREAWAAVCELFGVENVPKLIELAERVKQHPNGPTPAPDWDGIVTTLLESNAKLSETISAQGDQIMALSRGKQRAACEDPEDQIRRANMNGVFKVSAAFETWFVESRTQGYLRQFLELVQG